METGRRPDRGVCVAVDVHYLSTGGARAAAVLAADAAFAHVLAERTAVLPRVAPYQPGQFYLRELPPLRAVLEDLSGLGLLVVDGYADLDPAGRPGLGARAHAEFGIAVIGVAKSRFRTATHAVPVVRGASARPLFVTSAGMPSAEAADLVRRMAGRYRLPDALRRADTLARTDPSRQNLDVPVGSVHADPMPVGDQPGGIDHTDDGRQAVLPGDHRAVGHQASHLRDQARDRDEQRRPAGVRVGRDQDVARFEIGLRHIQDDAGPPFDDPGRDR
jgi:deoxyribonuclease V